MTAGTYRPAILYKIKAAIKDKKITASHLAEAAINSKIYYIIPNNYPAGAIPDYRVDHVKYDSNISTGAWRAPKVDMHFIKNLDSPTGLGEPTLPPAGGAVANAIYSATGKRLYKQPFAP